MKLEKLTYDIIGAAMNVHATLGNGFQEVIYQRALAIEFEIKGLEYARENEMSIFYRQLEIGTRRVDFFVEDKVLIELKAIIALEEIHVAQIMNYCQAYGLPFGLLFNFGANSLEFRRIYNLHHPDNSSYTNKSPQQKAP